ncbi:MAG: ABC transporter ATP-binding protein [Amphritea sp.]
MLKLHQVSKSYRDGHDEIKVLHQLNFEVKQGATVALMGESGAGKSTLLHICAGFDRVDSGQVIVDQQDLKTLNDAKLSAFRRKSLGVIFQQYNLIPTLSVHDNICFIRRLNGLADNDNYLGAIIKTLQLESLLNLYPEKLSGGEQQRVAIARALSHKPALLLADEPTGNLDEANSHRVMQLLQKLVQDQQMTLLLVTHSSLVAEYLSRTVYLHDGKIEHG